MNYLANKSLRFIADRFEEWSGGMCISQGPIKAEITATADKNGVRFEVIGADNLRMCKHASFAPISEGGMSMDMGTRLQYFNPAFSEGDPLDLIVCHVFYEGRTISYIRFAMSFPDRIIEFYGNTVSFDGIDRPVVTSGQRYPSFKKLFIDDLAGHYRLLLKENSVSIAIVDHQLACVAFCIKKYLAFLAMDNDDKEKYNIERLRLVGGILLILDAVALSLFSFLTGWSIMIFAALNFVGGILQGTWAKRKKDSDL